MQGVKKSAPEFETNLQVCSFYLKKKVRAIYCGLARGRGARDLQKSCENSYLLPTTGV
jgi:hypothetical protein